MSGKVRSIQRARDQKAAENATITATLAELLNSQGALQVLANQPFPASLSFKISKIMKAVMAELKTCDETRLKLCGQYGVLNQETDTYEFPDKTKLEELNKEYAELVKTEVTIPGERLDPDRLPELSISPSNLVVLGWLIKECE